jgi:NAD(P)-dependent dehydrogenase (short-subunit alcohol dehydrogenase family)
MPDPKAVALVTGGNRGLGFEICRQLAKNGQRVLLGSRDASKGEEAARRLVAEGLEVKAQQLDVTDGESIRVAAAAIQRAHGALDVLVNNAGVMLDGARGRSTSVFDAELEVVRRSFETNVLGALSLGQALMPLLRAAPAARIVNVSTAMAQLSEMAGSYPGYRMSKVALNALTRILADELRSTPIKVNCVCPGWVRTTMGGPHAKRSVEEGVETVVWLATLPADGPTGGFFRDQQQIPW